MKKLSPLFVLFLLTAAIKIDAQTKASDAEIGVVINGVCWATRNVDVPGAFAATPESIGKFYQWSRMVAYPATGEVAKWDETTPFVTDWDPVNDPCPDAWRLPTYTELQTLVSADGNWTTQNDVGGYVFGVAPNIVFLPAAGYRNAGDGKLDEAGTLGFYWTSTWNANGINSFAYYLLFDNTHATTTINSGRFGFPVRCVKE
ncbi:MAG: hypothetical protein LBR66_07115 [Candidatus Symbiothrix sp.]|jgi:uncharacterized protein (TIGR02145 family)|nr:hypothetical protein [Candidatus Symbiothrix sp.]